MLIGLGLDVIEISRVRRSWERFGETFTRRVLHPAEAESFSALRGGHDIFLASRFAAKEAAAKALGTGMSSGIGFADFCVRNAPSGKPELSFHNKALARLIEIGGKKADISITHSRETAAAVVIVT